MTDDAAAARVEVVSGGPVPPETLAALVVALTPVHVPGDDAAPRTPAWARAALLENVGGRRIAAPAELTLPGERPSR